MYGFIGNRTLDKVDILGRTSKADIDTGGLIYSTSCGWIDWGHSNPKGARKLWNTILNESGQGSGDLLGFKVDYNQGAGAIIGGIRVDVQRADGQYFVRRGLDEWNKREVALGIFKDLTDIFENDVQDGLMWSWKGSGNSEEDRPSNLIGFYRAVRGFSKFEIESVCHLRTKTESNCLWDEIGGLKKSKSWAPTDYNRQLEATLSSSGVKESIPKLSWPAVLNSVTAAPKGTGWRNWEISD